MLLVLKIVGDGFNDVVYQLHVQIKKTPFLEEHPLSFMQHLMAHDAIMGPLVWFFGIERVGTIVEVLHSTKHNGLPIVDNTLKDGKYEQQQLVFCNLVLISHILVLLKKKQFTNNRELGNIIICHVHEYLLITKFAKLEFRKGVKICDIQLDIDEEKMFLDLHLITNTSLYKVVETMSFAKTYALFQQLGVQHTCVMSKSSKVHINVQYLV